eukprot:TRINITY_DN1783_c0_g1_i1.p1 TRINITY_DN1783_c0_g1~~TRINITY_DN1783_c0_g1_i1.p1  ORF type:complete len:567 (+),score=155.77 TRINITY_DN1783_c0_g1_i1:96-1703(+)
MASGISGMLKEGSQHFSGVEQAVLRNVNACVEMAKVTRSSLGPNGMNKMVITQHDKLIVTSDAATIIRELEVVHPAAKMLTMASEMQEKESGDGTNFVIVFGGELLAEADVLIRQGLHVSEIIDGFQKAGSKMPELFEGLEVARCADTRNISEVAKFLRPVIMAKQNGYEDVLAPILAKACIDICPKDPTQFNVDNVRVVKVIGGGVSDTALLQGFAIPRNSETSIRHVDEAKVAIFVCGIEASKCETKSTVLINDADQLMNFTRGEEDDMKKIVDEIASSGVKVLVTGGPVSEIAKHFLERHGLMVIRVQSKFQLRRCARACGATPLTRLGKPTPEELGFCKRVSVDEVASTNICKFHNPKSRISTVIMRSATLNLLEDLERCVDDAVNAYKSLCKDPRFVAGAGACEMELSRLLTEIGEKTPGLDQYAIKKYAEAFEVVPRTLAQNAGHACSEAITRLQAAHIAGDVSHGIDIEEEGDLVNAVDKGIFDNLAVKQQAVRLATNAICTILRVDEIIMARPAGGPKAPKMGARDA